MPLLSRSRFAALARVGPKALLVWQDAGVLLPVRVDGDGTRWYEPAQLERAAAVRLLRDLGVPLAEVPALLDRPGAAVLADLHDRLRTRRAHETALLSALSPLLGLEAPVTHDVDLVPVPARCVLARRATTGVDGLPDLVRSGLAQLHEQAGGHVAGPPSVVFLHPVDDDRDGEVQLEVEVTAGCPGAEQRPAGRALAVRVRGQDAEYPRVLAAYDALAARAAQDGLELAGPPAETYDGDGTLVRWPVV